MKLEARIVLILVILFLTIVVALQRRTINLFAMQTAYCLAEIGGECVPIPDGQVCPLPEEETENEK